MFARWWTWNFGKTKAFGPKLGWEHFAKPEIVLKAIQSSESCPCGSRS